ncbi:hypothetical protein KQ308_03490, partial [Synechococcus sp. CS-1327]|nr:hypothetical protein [Synechococcus sp. CS-1326]MCT0232576.1 hypothetical protein [Synechococcus sp. CS-1327]
MAPLKYAKPERIWLKAHPELDEKWLQERIGEDPAILGLGKLWSTSLWRRLTPAKCSNQTTCCGILTNSAYFADFEPIIPSLWCP